MNIADETLARLKQAARLDGAVVPQVLLHLIDEVRRLDGDGLDHGKSNRDGFGAIIERLEALEQRPIPGTVELVDPTPEAAPVATDEELVKTWDTSGKSIFEKTRAVYDLGRKHGAAAPQSEVARVMDLPPVHETAPERIWLYLNGANELLPFKDEDGVVWSPDQIDKSDIPYVRADQARCPHLRSSDEGSAWCELAEQTAAAPQAEHDPTNAAPLLWLLWNHQGSGSPVGQPIRKYLGMGQFERMSEEQIEAAKSWGSIPFPVSPLPPAAVDAREPECVERWPDCHSDGYDPRCCRFPKSCSCGGDPPPAPPAAQRLMDAPMDDRGYVDLRCARLAPPYSPEGELVEPAAQSSAAPPTPEPGDVDSFLGNQIWQW